MLTPRVIEIRARVFVAGPTYRQQLANGAKLTQGSAILAVRCAS